MKKILLLFVLFSLGNIVRGNPIGVEKARQIALEYIKNNGAYAPSKYAQVEKVIKKVPLSTNAYYIFNVGQNNGFVIVSADDNMQTVLGHSKNGTFNEKNIPDGMKWWLECCQRYIKFVANNKHRINHIEESGWGVNIPINEDNTLNMDEMYIGSDINIGGRLFD